MFRLKLITIFFIFLTTLFANTAFAHGGIQNTAGNVTATFFIDPLVPKINQNATITFLLTDQGNGKRLTNYPAKLIIKETEDENEDHDRIIFEKDITTNINGQFQTDYVFSSVRIYDIELAFPKVSLAENSVGFLIQPEVQTSLLIIPIALLALFIGLIFGYKYKNNV